MNYLMTYLSKFLSYIGELWHSLFKFFMHLWTGKVEIHRICEESQGFHSYIMSIQFSRSLKRSKKLNIYSKIIFYPNPFSVDMVLNGILKSKNLEKCHPVIKANINHCLKDLRIINLSFSIIDKLKGESFDKFNSIHLKTIENLWENLKPGVRKSEEFVNEDWGEIGFQGKDPSTDFRGMGIWGLSQLVYFSAKYPSEAREILVESNHIRRYYPFAATGLNFSKFLLDLIRESRLYEYLLQVLNDLNTKITMNKEFNYTNDEDALYADLLMDYIHEIYCEIFIEFNKLWVKADPENILSFPTIFSQLQNKFRSKYHEL